MRQHISSFSTILLLGLFGFLACITIDDPTRIPYTLQPNDSAAIDWNQVFRQKPRISDLTIFHTGSVEVPMSGMINLADARLEGEKDKKIFVDVFSFWFSHEKEGCFIIDSGLDASYQSGGNIKGLLASSYVSDTKQQSGQDISSQLKQKKRPLKGVLFTHLHGDHTSGVPALPSGIEYFVGANEKYINFFGLYYTGHLDKVKKLIELNTEQGRETPILGKVVDVFGDGSLFAISTPGHSNAHLSYLITTSSGTYLFTGDASHTYRGWKMGIEPGWVDDREMARESLSKLRKFTEAYPAIKVIPGHELPPHFKPGMQ